MNVQEFDQCLMNKQPIEKRPVVYGSELDEIIAAWDRLSPEERERENAKLEEIAKSLGSGGP